MALEDPIWDDNEYRERIADILALLTGVVKTTKAMLALPGPFPQGTILEFIRQLREVAGKDGVNIELQEVLLVAFLSIAFTRRDTHGADLLAALQQLRDYRATKKPTEFPSSPGPSDQDPEEEDPGDSGPLLN